MRKWNVAIVVERLHAGGGVERRTLALVRGLASAGHEVHVYASGWTEDAADGAAGLHRIPMLRLGRRVKPLSFAWACSALIPRRHDLIHTQARIFRYDLATMGVGCHRAYLDAMGIDTRTEDTALHRTMLGVERRMLSPERFASGARLITNSHRCKGEFIDYYNVPEECISVVHNGVDQSMFGVEDRQEFAAHTREELGLSPDDVLLLFVGTGFDRKGLDTLIRAAGMLRDSVRKRVKVLVIGRGDIESRKKLGGGLRLGDRLMSIPRVDPWEIARYYAAADVYALPTRYDPFANSTMEALASGLPVVTTTVNGVSEILRDGESAFLVQPNDVEGLSERLSALVEDPMLRERIGAAGRAAAEPFTWQATTEKTLAVYESMV